MHLTIYTDGGSRGNPGSSASAFVVYSDNKLVSSGSKFLGTTTNNVAEYSAIIIALTWLEKYSKTKSVSSVDFIVDSQLAQRQLTGVYKVKDAGLKVLYTNVKGLVSTFNFQITFKHVPRSNNREADALVNQTLDENL